MRRDGAAYRQACRCPVHQGADADGRKRLSNAAIRTAFPNVVIVQQAAQEVLSGMLAAKAAHRCFELTNALYEFGRAHQGRYRALKTQRGLLDYDDRSG